MTDRVEALRQAAQARHSATLRRAEDALQAMVASGAPVTFARLAKAAKVSGPGSTAKTNYAPRCNATDDRAPPSPSHDDGTSRQPSSPSANSSTPTEKRSPAYQPEVPSTTSSLAASAPNEPTASPAPDRRRRHVHDVKVFSHLGFTRSGKENVHYGK